MAAVMLEVSCPDHGLERYKIKIIKKYNVNPQKMDLQFRTRPRHEISGVVIGKNVSYEEARDFVVGHLNDAVSMNLLSIRLLLK